MHLILLVLRYLLGSLFLISGVLKFRDLKAFSGTLLDFGFPAILTAPAGVLLSAFELSIACALFSSTFAAYGAWGALILLTALFAGISLMLVRGRRPDCNCFGRMHSRPVGRATLIRIGLLAVCAVWLVLETSAPWPSGLKRYVCAADASTFFISGNARGCSENSLA